MTIADTAYSVIVGAKILPTDCVGIERVKNSNWDGKTRLIISEGETEYIEHQLGVSHKETQLYIYVVAENRHVASGMCSQAGELVFKEFESIEGVGVLSISRVSSGVNPIGDRAEFEAFRSYKVIHCLDT
jgi:hypothetical protein